MKYFAGLDVSLDETAICVVDEDGIVVTEGKAASEPADLVRWLVATGLTITRVGLEAGPLSPWLHTELRAAGLPAICIETYMDEYLAGAGTAEDRASPLFRSAAGKTGKLTERGMHRTDALRMIWRRARDAGIETALGCHSFRATGITVYLMNGGLLEHAQQMAAHESARTTKLYDRRNDQLTLDEVERIVL